MRWSHFLGSKKVYSVYHNFHGFAPWCFVLWSEVLSYPKNVPDSFYLSEIRRRRSSGRLRKSACNMYYNFLRLICVPWFFYICASCILNGWMKNAKTFSGCLKTGEQTCSNSAIELSWSLSSWWAEICCDVLCPIGRPSFLLKKGGKGVISSFFNYSRENCGLSRREGGVSGWTC